MKKLLLILCMAPSFAFASKALHCESNLSFGPLLNLGKDFSAPLDIVKLAPVSYGVEVEGRGVAVTETLSVDKDVLIRRVEIFFNGSDSPITIISEGTEEIFYENTKPKFDFVQNCSIN